MQERPVLRMIYITDLRNRRKEIQINIDQVVAIEKNRPLVRDGEFEDGSPLYTAGDAPTILRMANGAIYEISASTENLISGYLNREFCAYLRELHRQAMAQLAPPAAAPTPAESSFTN